MNVVQAHNTISGVYKERNPVKQQCRDNMYSTSTGARACAWHGGVKKFVGEDDILHDSAEYIILHHLRSTKLNKAKVEAYTGLKVGRGKDIRPEYVTATGGTSVEALIEYIQEDNLFFYNIDFNDIGMMIQDYLQFSYAENLDRIKYMWPQETIFGVSGLKVYVGRNPITSAIVAGGLIYGLYKILK